MRTPNTVSQSGYLHPTTRPTLDIPVELWKDVKRGALDEGMTAQDFVIAVLRERVQPKKIRKAS